MPSFENMTLPPQSPENSEEQEQEEKEAILQKQKELIASEKETPFVYSKNVLEGIKGDFKKLGVMAASGELSYEQFKEMKVNLEPNKKDIIRNIFELKKTIKEQGGYSRKYETILRNNNLLPTPDRSEVLIHEYKEKHPATPNPNEGYEFKLINKQLTRVPKNETGRLYDVANSGRLSRTELFNAEVDEDDRLMISLILDLSGELEDTLAKMWVYNDIIRENKLKKD